MATNLKVLQVDGSVNPVYSGPAIDDTKASSTNPWSGAKVKAELDAVKPITQGGTGATTAEQARTNLGASASGHTHTLDSLNNVHICDSTPTSLIEGHWYLIKDA